jgi:large repetitive protein
VTIKSPDTGDKDLTNTATSAATGSTCPPGGPSPSCTATVIVLVPGLTITNTASAQTASPGSAVTYTITIANTGQTTSRPATVQANLSGVLNDASYAGGATASTGMLSYSQPVLTWTGNLTSGATAQRGSQLQRTWSAPGPCCHRPARGPPNATRASYR